MSMKRITLVKPVLRTPKKASQPRGSQTQAMVLYNPPRNNYQRGVESHFGGSRGELKAFDTTVTLAFDTAGTFSTLNLPVNGPELYQRIGRKIYMRNVHLRGVINLANTAANSAQDFLRVLLIYDRQSNGALPNIASILQDSNAGAGSSVLSEINLTNRARFQVLRDFQMVPPMFQNGTFLMSGLDQTRDFQLDWFVKLRGLEAEFNGVNGGTIADITSGSLFVVCQDQNNLSTWQLQLHARLRYYDT